MRRKKGRVQPRGPIEVPDDILGDSGDDFSSQVLDTADYHQGSSGMGAVVVNHLVTAMLIAMGLALGVWGYLTFKNAEAGTLVRPGDRPFEREAVEAQLQRIDFAVQTYHVLYGDFPKDANSLVEEGLLEPDDLRYPPGPVFVDYEKSGDVYELVVQRPATEDENSGSEGSAATDEGTGTNGGATGTSEDKKDDEAE